MSLKSATVIGLLVFSILSVADLSLTWVLIEYSGGRVRESNPVAHAWLEAFGWHGLVWFKAITMLVVAMVVLVLRRIPAPHGARARDLRQLGGRCGRCVQLPNAESRAWIRYMDEKSIDVLASPGRRLRQAWTDRPIPVPGVFNGLVARMAERLGYQAIYLSGAALSAAAGVPDVGLLGRTTLSRRRDPLPLPLRCRY